MAALFRPALLVGAAAAAVAYYYLRGRDESEFTVLTWNVLAAEFTMFNKELPGCVQGHRNPDGKLETSSQTSARYALAAAVLLARGPDAVLLQELSVDFFDPDINPKAPALLERYMMAHATNSPSVGDDGPGTAVLLRKGGPLTATGVAFSVGANSECGGTSKSASGVLVRVGSRGAPCWLASVHAAPLKYKPEAVRTHLALLGEQLRQRLPTAPPRIFIGGDLNADVDEVATLQNEYPGPLGSLHRLLAPGDTGLSANFSAPCCIDHLFISPGLRLVGAVELERTPSSPYGEGGGPGPAPVHFPSDHVWQCVRLAAD